MSGAEVLLSRSWELRPPDSSTLRSVNFDVPEGLEVLELRFRFRPPACADRKANEEGVRRAVQRYVEKTPWAGRDDQERLLREQGLAPMFDRVNNLLNLTLYDPAGRYVGRWDTTDRDNPAPGFVSQNGSSGGFFPSPVFPGRWTIVLEAWWIFHLPCRADLEVLGHRRGGGVSPSHVSGFGSPSAAPGHSPGWESVPGGGRKAAPARASRRLSLPVPRVRLAGLYYGEMHAHTNHSDGRHTLAELAEKAACLDLDFVAVTDHNATSAHAEIDPAMPVTLLRGEELTTFDGHFCVYGVDRCYEWHDRRGRKRTRVALADAAGRGALVSLAHPFAMPAPVCVGCRFRMGSVPARQFQLMEIWSGSWRIRYPEIRAALAHWDRLWSRGVGLVGIAARDWHGPAQEDTPAVPFPATAVFAEGPDEVGLLRAVAQGRAIATTGPVVRLELAGEAGRAGLGETLSLAEGERGEAGVDILFPGEPRGVARLLCNGRVLEQWTLTGAKAAVRRSCPVSRPGRYRVELWSEAGELVAVTNHVFVSGGGK